MTSYRTQTSIFEEKLKVSKQNLENKRVAELEAKQKSDAELKLKQEQDLQEEQDLLNFFKDINFVLFPLKLQIFYKLKVVWYRNSKCYIEFPCVALYSSNTSIRPQFVCHYSYTDRILIKHLNNVLESAEFAELVEELSDPNLKWDKIKHGPKMWRHQNTMILLIIVITLSVALILHL